MKYIYINDLLYFIKNHKKLIFTYILTTILYFIYNYFIQEETSSNLILETLTLNCDFKLDLWLNLIVFVLYISIHCFIALQLFINDFKNSPSNLFLRIDSRKWILCKLFSILTISILLLSTLIFLIGASRIYLGVHYASDVIGGFLLAISYLALYIEVSKLN